jgi:hypothetical protein
MECEDIRMKDIRTLLEEARRVRSRLLNRGEEKEEENEEDGETGARYPDVFRSKR